MIFVPKLARAETDDAIRKCETRKLTLAGWFWPLPRAQMRHGPTIRARMIEDLRFAPVVSSGANAATTAEKHLQTCGWSTFQIIDHAPRAIEDFLRAKTRSPT